MNTIAIQILILRALENIRPQLTTSKVLHVDVNCMGGPAVTLSEVHGTLGVLEGNGLITSVRGLDNQLRYAITDSGRAFLQQYA